MPRASLLPLVLCLVGFAAAAGCLDRCRLSVEPTDAAMGMEVPPDLARLPDLREALDRGARGENLRSPIACDVRAEIEAGFADRGGRTAEGVLVLWNGAALRLTTYGHEGGAL